MATLLSDILDFLMQSFRPLCRILAIPVATIFFLTTLPINIAFADLVPTEQILAQNDAAGDRATVDTFLQRDDVRKQLESFGVDPNEAKKRVQSLSDEEIKQIAGRIESVPAGEGAFEAVLIAAVVIFLILILTDLLGVTDIFPFIKPARIK